MKLIVENQFLSYIVKETIEANQIVLLHKKEENVESDKINQKLKQLKSQNRSIQKTQKELKMNIA